MTNNKNYSELDKIVSRATKGDKNAFTKLCEIEAPHIIYSCTKLMNNKHDGEDAAQEVFIALQQSISRLQTPEAFITWLQKLIFNTCSKMRRDNMNFSEPMQIEDFSDLFAETDNNFLPEEYFIEKEKRDELLALIDTLPPQIRTCIFLHYFNELKISEISDLLEISESSVKGYLYVGREKLRKQVKSKNGYNFLNSAHFLPMMAIAGLFKTEMAEIVDVTIISTCLAAVGVQISTWWQAFTALFVKGALGVAATTIVATTALVGYTQIAQSPSLSPFVYKDDRGGAENMSPNSGGESTGNNPSGVLPSALEGGSSSNSYAFETELLLESDDCECGHINPQRASVTKQGQGNFKWNISQNGSDVASGNGTEVTTELQQLYEQQKNGSYTIRFTAKDEKGYEHYVSTEILIYTEKIEQGQFI